MKALCFGSMNIDYVYSLDHIVGPGETIFSTGREIFAGGKGLNQSVAMAKAGLPGLARRHLRRGRRAARQKRWRARGEHLAHKARGHPDGPHHIR